MNAVKFKNEEIPAHGEAAATRWVLRLSPLRAVVMAALLAGTGCDPMRDRDGCWKDGDEAFIAMCEAGCTLKASCTEYNTAEFSSDQEYYDACVLGCSSAQYIAQVQEAYCFDGCLVDNCLELTASYAETCDEAEHERLLEQCDEDNTPFWNLHSSPARSCNEDERGWS